MKMRPKSTATLLAGITLLFATTSAQAGDSFFSFSFGYSNHHVRPYPHVYAPVYINTVPSPFFFGYTSYYYPVFPYYYTPVVYYRPFLPYRYPYAYHSHRNYHWHKHAYRKTYPYSYFHGNYAHNHYYRHKPYYYDKDYYDRHAQYRFKSGTQHYTGLNTRNLVVNSPDARNLVKNPPAQRQSQQSVFTDTIHEQQRIKNLEKHRLTLHEQRRHNQQYTDINRRVRNQYPPAGTARNIAIQQNQKYNKENRFNQKFQKRDSSSNVHGKTNNRIVEQLINRDRGSLQMNSPDNDRRQNQVINRPVQRNIATNNKKQRMTLPISQYRQFKQQTVRQNTEKSNDNNTYRRQIAIYGKKQDSVGLPVVRQVSPSVNTLSNSNPSGQRPLTKPGVSGKNRKSQDMVAQRSGNSGKFSSRNDQQVSFRNSGGLGMQHLNAPKRISGSMPGFRR